MMNHRLSLFSSGTIARRGRLLAATAVVASLAMAVTVLPAPPASAAPGEVADFSNRVSANPRTFTVDDCTVEVGVVLDSWPYPHYRLVGGVRVNCRSRHSVIDATVALYYYNGSNWVQYGSSSYAVRYNATGSGYQQQGILRTPYYCVNRSGDYWWSVGFTVRTERTGGTGFSYYYNDPPASCPA